MSKMYKKQKRSIELLMESNCSGDMKICAIYDPIKRAVFTVTQFSIEDYFDKCISNGTDDSNFQCLIENNSIAKKIWSVLQKELTPKFKTGDFVVFSDDHRGSSYSLKSPLWQVGDITSWKKCCDWRSSEVSYQCTRKFSRVDSTETKEENENNAVFLQAFENLKGINDTINKKIKKILIEAGIKNASLNYLGKAYRIG